MVTEIFKDELQITRDGYIRIFETYKRKGSTVKEAYYAVEDICSTLGHKSRFQNFESFKEFYYSNKLCKK